MKIYKNVIDKNINFWDYIPNKLELERWLMDNEFMEWMRKTPKCPEGKAYMEGMGFNVWKIGFVSNLRNWISYCRVVYEIRDYLPKNFELKCCDCGNTERIENDNCP